MSELPVLASEAEVARARPAPGARAELERAPSTVMPAVQAAAVAAGGFMAGAAVAGIVHRRQSRAGALAKGRARRALGRRRASTGAGAELLQVVASRSLLVDVHLLGGAGEH